MGSMRAIEKRASTKVVLGNRDPQAEPSSGWGTECNSSFSRAQKVSMFLGFTCW